MGQVGITIMPLLIRYCHCINLLPLPDKILSYLKNVFMLLSTTYLIESSSAILCIDNVIKPVDEKSMRAADEKL